MKFFYQNLDLSSQCFLSLDVLFWWSFTLMKTSTSGKFGKLYNISWLKKRAFHHFWIAEKLCCLFGVNINKDWKIGLWVCFEVRRVMESGGGGGGLEMVIWWSWRMRAGGGEVMKKMKTIFILTPKGYWLLILPHKT